MNRFIAALVAAIAVAFGPGATPEARAQGAEASETAVKAAFLYKFANYIEWPAAAWASATAPLVIGVIGGDEVAAELERIVPGRAVNGHPVAVRRLSASDPARGIHLLFVGKEAGSPAAVLKAAQQQGVLAVTEHERALEAGATINFVPAGDRIGFEVSLDSAEKTGHRISARMLTVARRVVPRS